MVDNWLKPWCDDAVTLLETAGLSGRTAAMMREAIERHAGTQVMYEIAEELADGLSHLPTRSSDGAQAFLKEKHGFGFDLFIDAKMKRIRAILKRGRIRTEDEHRDLLELLSDATLSPVARAELSRILARHESGLATSPKGKSGGPAGA